MKKYLVISFFLILTYSCVNSVSKCTQSNTNTEVNSKNKSIYKFSYSSPSGEIKSLDDYKEKVILIVNTATKCGLTPQFKGLEELHQKYSKQGLVVLGFPCNQFGGQEPLTNEEMVESCRINHGVTFELTKKIEVNGENENGIYTFLKSEQSLGDKNDIRWNFEKFLINKKGEVVKRYSPRTKPKQIISEIEGLL